MRIIQDRELIRITTMLKGDSEMRNLGITTLNKCKYRFNFITILVFHILLFEIGLIATIWLCYQFHLGLYWIPVLTFNIFQLLLSICYLDNIWMLRKKYNEYMQTFKQ